MAAQRRLVALTATATLATVLTATPALAAPSQPGPGGYRSVATGLNNPRHLSFDRGTLYVAEAGLGGEGPCLTGGEGRVCFGLTGSVTRVKANGAQDRVLDRLPSLINAEGSGTGPADIDVRGSSYLLSFGLGADPSLRSSLLSASNKQANQFATVQRGTFPGPRKTLGDLAAFEAANNPDGTQPDTNPVGLTRHHGGVAVADAGANDVVHVKANGQVHVIATLPTQLMLAPPFLGLPAGTKIPAQAVPTSVVEGPDGALYVSQLTGFPFEKGKSTIYRIAMTGKGQHTLTPYATGLTNVTDLAWHDGTLYAVQIADNGLLNGPKGSLVKIVDGAPQTVSRQLPSPYGVAFNNGQAYVSVNASAPRSGQVVEIPLG